ncbi:crotonobetainyl-CoA:carnitine CoA-transferase CaiB-like acyl-CoA transferase [Crenobacter luteus]|uniref:CaiB/BaiF CoA transferase family protein n=1 Tax=Crenobacter luteus TaxID=1452487 RepID=UPI001050471B|nr:CaiB/BaiF CoA-transferase family protein [Crenobacter luteus]TCP11856.1 crotonobetainyl-CoA:carnitine CoA-transferase CaiB-like acyl-CoA transferase [Crenobacter luteus]
MAKPLAGITVLDLSRVLAGPWASQLLADLGADVIKIEKPGGGDDTRAWAPPAASDGSAAYFLAANRGKRSIALDIARPEGQAVVRRLAERADVLLENYKVGGLAKYGLDYDSLARINPALVYCSITGFGQDGPAAELPGYDYIVQGLSGLMSVTGPADGEPSKVGVAVTDLFTGLYAANAVQAALIERTKTGRGAYIDLALFDCSLAMLANVALNHLVSGAVPPRLGNGHPNIVPYQVFATRDGHLILACGNDKQFSAVCTVLGVPQLARDERFASNPARVAHRAELVPRLAELFRADARDAWLEKLTAAGVPCGPILNVAEAFAHPQARHRGMSYVQRRDDGTRLPQLACPIRLNGAPARATAPPPRLNEHGEALLAELGYDDEEIAALRQSGALGPG